MDRRSDESQRIAKRILEVAAIRKMHRLIAVRKKRDRRRLRFQLRRVIQESRASPHSRRSVLRDRALEDLIQLRYTKTFSLAVYYRVNVRKNVFDVAPPL